ncbi:mannose-1-phosphate guanylyltransferase/mannose-6-phosphate isomerase [Kaistia algarum]|uniref:mannose-1-phosphate guanylyltransferase/mannose-6-phosphate isomerase n=1 Tax=Kaistia algarum TaxID=2083279 RepID=UPI000CE8152E|nr:mannose-1-phosphate guanylyltransferase/mannose-6-phosphate isomerase [Kaistia algarum]MCX5513616.1 mannose-1-phosphate guanylyltransferase/mannose-6-phosphate isomerase [Kaistia algarum]PPE79499.1 mannose-1-phosphate guanylyltransferase/mannose-6-phosphate isomerase [Kaistia algarum]
MANAKIVPVILAGGSGTRLWPVSRDSMPKQFLALGGKHTFYQQTLLRVPGASDTVAAPIIVTSEDFRFFARRQAAELGIDATIVLEPARRDSAAAIFTAAQIAANLYGEDCLVLALAADHLVPDVELFRNALLAAAEVAQDGYIVTFGIKPTEPRTSYGYIKPGAALGTAGASRVASFVEKPDRETAERYLAEGYLWNSGNFIFPASLMLAEAERFEPAILAGTTAAIEAAKEDIGFIRLDKAAFATIPAKSIDYAVLERTDKAAVIEGRFAWSDIGSWDAVRELGPVLDGGNVTHGPVSLLDSHDVFIHSEGPLVTGIGLEGITVVASDDAILVMPSNRSQDVKDLVAGLKAEKRNEANEHIRIHRPWGTYETICRGERFHVKKIVVEPGAILSLQKHHHRAEHWVIVKGTAEVTQGDRTYIVNENQSTYHPIGEIHRVANPGKIPLELIEVQTGSYLGEDDIVRYEDVYNRA